MPETHDRPDPDVLLRRMQEAEQRAKRGRLEVFFGFAPGVGKTYRMLQVAHELRDVQQLDVVVGVVEDHRRADTAALATGLERVPLRAVAHRGRTLMELDVDAIIARAPKVVLVDELAHTNAPGSRHPKRWQDVEELRDAGIDVLTTLNVQHLESLNDVVAQVTRVQVRETLPDSVLDRADTIELVDVSPEQLLQRLKEGKVYLSDQAERAAQHFFSRGNLLALRELALRRAAQHVDDDVRAFREEHGVETTWAVSERILVCVGPAPSSARLIRSAARMAAGLRCPWVACYVEAALDSVSDANRERLEEHLRVAESLGASVTRLSGQRVSDAILAYARRNNVTRILIGKPTHSRLRDRLWGSLLDDVVRGSGTIDVHAIHGEEPGDEPARREAGRTERAPSRHYAYATATVLLTLAVGSGLRAWLHLPDLEMLFLLAVMVVAGAFGRGPSVLAAALGVACYDFFFVPPFHTFHVDDRRYVLTFGMMFAVGLAMSELAARLRRQERDALGREERTAVLYALTRELAAMDVAADIAVRAAGHASRVFAARVVVLTPTVEGNLQQLGTVPHDATLDENERVVAEWSFEHDDVAGLGTDTLPGSSVLAVPLRAGAARLGVLMLLPTERTALRVDQRAFLDVFARQVAAALERARLSEEAKNAALRAKTEEMRSSLLSAVSHDLRTPLASITGAATVLRDGTELASDTKSELVESIVDQAARLERLVANLLDMTRLEAGAVTLRKDWVPLDEIVGSALTRLEERLGARTVSVDIPADVPLLSVDPVLFEQLFVNLLENADKYTPKGALIEIRARTQGEQVAIDFLDEGSGLPSGTETQVFEKFFRGPHTGVGGAGLGLPICKGVVEAHGGTITAANRPSGGAAFHIVVPTGGLPPEMARSGAPPVIGGAS